MVNDLGMKVVSSHASFMPEQSRQVIDAHLELGFLCRISMDINARKTNP